MNTPAKLTIAAALILATGLSVSQGKEANARRAAKRTGTEAGAGRAEGLEAAKTKRETARAAAEARRTEAKETKETATEKRKEALSEKAGNRTEARQEHQARRIEEGIKKGYLTPDEISKLDTQQKSIETLQQSLTADGKVTKSEANQLRTSLNEASLCIFAEKHDADGNTKPVLRFGRNITLKNDVAQKLGDENLSKQDARAYLKDFHRMTELKKTLSGNVSDTDRAAMQAEYNDLLNKYFDSK